jgi:hypothetical protein
MAAGAALGIVTNILGMVMSNKKERKEPEPVAPPPQPALQNPPFEQTFPRPRRLDVDIPLTRRT